MKGDLTASQFDYSAIDSDSKTKLIWLAGEINKQKSSGLKAMLEMGKAIIEGQSLLSNHSDGTFGKWIETECGISRQSAYNYLRAYQRFGSCKSLLQLTAEAMYLLSAPSAPEDAAAQAQKLADKGIKVTAKVAKDLLDPPAARPSREKKQEPETPHPAQPAPTLTKRQQARLAAQAADAETSDAERNGQPEPDPDSLEAVQADLKEYEKRLRDLTRFARGILRCEANEVTRPFCGCYSVLTMIHPLQHVARTVMNDLPVGGTPAKPVLFHEQQAATR